MPPLVIQGWDLTWLSEQAGWLEDSAFPTHVGNSVITGHVYLANGKPGPFVDIDKLKWDDKILIHLDDQIYEFRVRSNKVTSPTDLSMFKPEKYTWITLITCQDYDEETGTYAKRVAIKAVLLKVY